MLSKLLSLLRRKKPELPWNPGRVWKMWEYSCWGNNMEWSNWDARRVVGWYHDRRQIRVDDEFQARMASGKIARFRVREVEYCAGVDDMFFATLEDVAYL